MQTVGILILIFITCLIAFSVQGCRNSKSGGGSSSNTTVTVQQVESMSRAQIEQMLQKLEKQRAPKRIINAMCYDIVAPPSEAEYVCPVCGQKTLYSGEEVNVIDREIESCRREFEQVYRASNLKMVLDESSFCAKCSPNATQHQLILNIWYSDGSTHSAPIRDQWDLRILRDFFRGRTAYEGAMKGDVIPLSNRIPRIRTLLGLDDPAAKGRP